MWLQSLILPELCVFPQLTAAVSRLAIGPAALLDVIRNITWKQKKQTAYNIFIVGYFFTRLLYYSTPTQKNKRGEIFLHGVIILQYTYTKTKTGGWDTFSLGFYIIVHLLKKRTGWDTSSRGYYIVVHLHNKNKKQVDGILFSRGAKYSESPFHINQLFVNTKRPNRRDRTIILRPPPTFHIHLFTSVCGGFILLPTCACCYRGVDACWQWPISSAK